jgi:polyisoprenoid-binding protein YceI
MRKLALGAVALFALAAACSPAPAIDAAPAVAPEAAAPAPIAITVPAGEYAVDPNHASITASLQHLGLSYYTVRFRTYDATVTFDPANIAASKVTASVKPSDILVGLPGDYTGTHPGTKFTSWEDDLANSTNFLDAGQFPAATFTSTTVEPSGERSAKVTGDLTIKGVTKPVTLDVTFAGETASHPFAKTPAIGFSAVGTFKRSEFGLSNLPVEVAGDDITLRIEGDFIQKPAA